MGVACGAMKVGSKLGYIDVTDTMATAAGLTDVCVYCAAAAGLETKIILDTIEERNSQSSTTK